MFTTPIRFYLASFLAQCGTDAIRNKVFNQVKTILDSIILAILRESNTIRILNLRLVCRCRGGLHGDIIP